MAWIDYKKAYDLVPHSCIKECMELMGIAESVRELLEKSMSGTPRYRTPKWRNYERS